MLRISACVALAAVLLLHASVDGASTQLGGHPHPLSFETLVVDDASLISRNHIMMPPPGERSGGRLRGANSARLLVMTSKRVPRTMTSPASSSRTFCPY